MKLQEQTQDKRVIEIIELLRDNNFGNEQSRKELLDLLTSLHNSSSKISRRAFRKIGDLFTDIGDDLIDMAEEEKTIKRYKQLFK